MDSSLDRIFRTTFRTTESADTGMGIRREEPRDDHKRRKDQHPKDDEKTQWEDDTRVSIAGLKQFLLTLVTPQTPAPLTEIMPAAAAVPSQANPSARQQRAHMAARAYQSTAQHNPTPAAPPVASVLPATTPPPPQLSAEENRMIHQLLLDLDILLQAGLSALTIAKEGTFLESLYRAAQRAKESIGAE